MVKLTLVVLAAGIGSRYGGIKQMDPVGPSGEIIIDYSVYDAIRAGFDKVVFVLRKEIEGAFREKVGRAVERNCETAYVLQGLADLPSGISVPPGREKPWGTGHALLVCKRDVDTPFAVINADDFYGRSSYQALSAYLHGAADREAHEYCMVGYQVENTLTDHGHVSRGICETSPDMYLEQINERLRVEKTGTGARYQDGEHWRYVPRGSVVSMNMWGFTPSVFHELESRFPPFLIDSRDQPGRAEYLLPRLVNDLVTEDRARVRVLPTTEQWFGVTYRDDRVGVQEAIRELVARGHYPADLWNDA